MSLPFKSLYKADFSFWCNYACEKKLFPAKSTKDYDSRMVIEYQCIELSIENAYRVATEFSVDVNEIPYFTSILDTYKTTLEYNYSTHIPRFAEYVPRKNQIILYNEVIKVHAATQGLSMSNFEKVCIAHELFHVLEHKTQCDTQALIKKKLFANHIFSYNRFRSKIYSISSEISAHTFAKIILDTQYELFIQ